MSQARLPMTVMEAIPQPTPIPAAAPALSPEELVREDCPTGTAVPVEPAVAEDAVGELVRLVVAAEAGKKLVTAEVVEAEDVDTVPVWEVAEGSTVMVLKSSRWSGTVSPKVASGLLLHADCIALRKLPRTTEPVPACRQDAHVFAFWVKAVLLMVQYSYCFAGPGENHRLQEPGTVLRNRFRIRWRMVY